jgi:predicted nucleotidyltransferase
LTGLPEKIRKTLEKLVTEKRTKEGIYGIALFGSWSRGDAAASSDVDLMILDKRDFDSEYIERIELNGLLIDLDNVPKRWLSGPIPSEIDQKLHEMQILYDRDWSLHNTKLLMANSYSSPERVDIRTEKHVVDSDIYLSRATSALSREDFRSAYLFATTALESILNILVEIALEPSSNSRFIEKLGASAVKLGSSNLFNEYLHMAELSEVDDSRAKEKLRLFKIIWSEMKTTVNRNPQEFESSHFKVKTKLNYYLNSAFLQGMILRTNSLIESGKAAEASHYLRNIFLNAIESYLWLKSSIYKVKVDHTTLMHFLEALEEKNPKNYDCIAKFLNLTDITKLEASNAIEKAREITLKIRKQRKILIKNHLLS